MWQCAWVWVECCWLPSLTLETAADGRPSKTVVSGSSLGYTVRPGLKQTKQSTKKKNKTARKSHAQISLSFQFSGINVRAQLLAHMGNTYLVFLEATQLFFRWLHNLQYPKMDEIKFPRNCEFAIVWVFIFDIWERVWYTSASISSRLTSGPGHPAFCYLSSPEKSPALVCP